MQVVDVNLVFYDPQAQVVRQPDDLTALDASPGHPHAEGKRVVVSPLAALSGSLLCTIGVRPNFPLQMTSVESSRPRCFRSFSNAAVGWSTISQFF